MSEQPRTAAGRNANVYLGSSVTDAFYEAVRRWQAQRDSDPNRLDTHDLVEQAFARHGLAIEAEAAAPLLRAALEFTVEHRLCGPIYDGCYSHWSHMEHCRADGMAWPCDVDRLRAAVASAGSASAALDVEAVWAHVVCDPESHAPTLLSDEEERAVNAEMREVTLGRFVQRAWIQPGPLAQHAAEGEG